MNDFLYELAMMKYRMYHELFKINTIVSRSEDCYNRIKYLAKYDQLLQIINLLPLKQSQEMLKIEQDYFSDAPYVTKK